MSSMPASKPADGSNGGPIRRRNEARILEAAEQVFAEAGFGGATMAAIAERAALPKANIHYYFGTKEQLYRAVLADILALWLGAADDIRPDADPAAALTAYIRAKMRMSRVRPYASKVFANEVLHGAPQIASYLGDHLRRWVDDKVRVIEGWVRAGRMAAVDARHLFFLIWAMTQTYADFDVQIGAVLGVPRLDNADFETGCRMVETLVLRGCGLMTK